MYISSYSLIFCKDGIEVFFLVMPGVHWVMTITVKDLFQLC